MKMCILVLLLLINRLEVMVGTKMDWATIQDLMSPNPDLAEGCGYQGCPETAEGMLNVHIVPHTHGELGENRNFHQYFTGVIEGDPTPTNINMKRILDFVTSQLWEKEKRKFTLYDTPYLFHWWSKRDDTVYRMIYQLLRQGRLHIVGGGWGMPDTASTSYHALIDHFTLALRKLNRTLGPCARPLVAWQADVFGHSREFASLASQFAFDGLFINPISFEDEVARMQAQELEMIWRGSDDLGTSSDIFTHKLFDGYWSPPGFCFSSDCNDSLIVHSDSLFRNYHQRVTEFIEAAKHRQGGSYATNHVMIVMGKRLAYYDANMWFENIDVLIDKVNEQSVRDNEKVHVMYSAPACYLKAVHETGVSLPLKQDDFMSVSYDKLTHFTGHFTSRPTLKYMAREGHVYLQMAKQMYVFANLTTKKLKLYDDLAWINGIFQDHTIITGNMLQEVCDYYTQKMYRAVQKSTAMLQTAFNKLRGSAMEVRYYRCAFNISSCRNTNALRSYVVIYNPLAWPVTVPVRLPVVKHSMFIVYNHKLSTVRSVMMKMPLSVLRIPYRDTRADHEIIFLAEKLPPMGYRSYYIESVTVATRRKRSIVKKIRKDKKKKYITRQTNQMKIDDKSMLDTMEHEVYDYGDEDEDSDDDYEDTTDTLPIATGTPRDTTDSLAGTLAIPFDPNITPYDNKATTDASYDKPDFSYEKPDFTYIKSDIPYDKPDVTYVTSDVPDDKPDMAYIKSDIPYDKPDMAYAKSDTPYEKPDFAYKKSDVPYNKINMTDNDMAYYDDIRVSSRSKQTSPRSVTSSTAPPSDISEEDNDMPLLRIQTPTNMPWAPNYRISPFDTTTQRVSNKTVSEDESELIERRKFFDTAPLKSLFSSTTPRPVRTTTTERYYDGFNDPDLDEVKHYYYRTSVKNYIRNKYVKLHLDHKSLIKKVTLSNGVQMALTIEFFYYVSDDPRKLDRAGEKRPGPNVFRPMDPAPVKILEHLVTAIHKTYLCEEVQYSVADWLGFVVRVYAERPIIEVDWVVGPVPIHDALGKEIFVRYSTDLVNDGVFYTDSNGRQTVKRIRNKRPGYSPIQTNIPSNIYPVTSKIHIEDTEKNIRFSVFNDRSQGGTSLHDGQIDLMLHRRILTHENIGETWLNETEFGRGIMVRGKHYLYVSKSNYKPNKIFEKKFTKEIELSPQVFACPSGIYGHRMKQVWASFKNQFRGVAKKLPVGVHVLTLQEWNDGTLLLRLENYLEKSDIIKDGVRTVYVKNLFANLIITELKETTLGGNVWMKDHAPLRWNMKDKFVKNFNEFYGGNGSVEYDNSDLVEPEIADIERGIKLLPQQIRTFVVTYERTGV